MTVFSIGLSVDVVAGLAVLGVAGEDDIPCQCRRRFFGLYLSLGPHLLRGTKGPLMGGGVGGSGFLVVGMLGSTTSLVRVLTVNLNSIL